jgi:hypothetical protein
MTAARRLAAITTATVLTLTLTGAPATAMPAPTSGGPTGTGSVSVIPNSRHIGHPVTPRINGIDRDCLAPPNPYWSAAAPLSLPSTEARRDRVLVVGDSLTRDSASLTASKLAAGGWNGHVDAVGGRYIYDAITAFKRATAEGRGVPNTVVIALGTNGKVCPASTRAALIKNVMKALGPKRAVYWVNVNYRGSGTYSATRFNALLADTLKAYPNARVLNWASYAGNLERAGVPIVSGDGIHLTSTGYAHRASFIRNSLTARKAWVTRNRT